MQWTTHSAHDPPCMHGVHVEQIDTHFRSKEPLSRTDVDVGSEEGQPLIYHRHVPSTQLSPQGIRALWKGGEGGEVCEGGEDVLGSERMHVHVHVYTLYEESRMLA